MATEAISEKYKAIIAEVKENLVTQKLPSGYKLKLHSSWTFSADGFILPGNFVSINYNFKGEFVPIGFLSFSCTQRTLPNDKNIDLLQIDYVQGVKNNRAAEGLVYPKNWSEQLMSSFLQSAIPVSFKNKQRVFYNSIDVIKSGVAFDKGELELIRAGKQKHYNKAYKEQLTNKLKTIHGLRDKFFDKNGFVNYRKERVQRIFRKTVKLNLRRKIPIKPQNIKKSKKLFQKHIKQLRLKPKVR